MKSSQILLFSCLLIASSFATASGNGRAFFYTFQISNAANPDEAHSITARVAKALGKLSESCVDLQSLGSEEDAQGGFHLRSKIGIVMNSRISQKVEDSIRRAICTKKEGLPEDFINDKKETYVFAELSKCKVSISFKSVPVKDLELELWDNLHKDGAKVVSTGKLDFLEKLPQFSDSCSAGVRRESRGNVASNQETRKALAVVSEGSKFDSVSMKTNELNWNFGYTNKETQSAVRALSGTSILRDRVPGQKSNANP